MELSWVLIMLAIAPSVVDEGQVNTVAVIVNQYNTRTQCQTAADEYEKELKDLDKNFKMVCTENHKGIKI